MPSMTISSVISIINRSRAAPPARPNPNIYDGISSTCTHKVDAKNMTTNIMNGQYIDSLFLAADITSGFRTKRATLYCYVRVTSV